MDTVDSLIPSGLNPVLSVSGLEKSYAGPVLQDVAFALLPGEIHALVGENGAGKSTLSRLLAGITPPDRGTMQLDGQAYAPRNRRDAERQGVYMVLQELNLIAHLSVAENLYFEALPHRWGWINQERLHRDACAVLDRVGLQHLDPSTPVSQLGVGEQQLVEIARSLWRRCRILILDEPTAALASAEVDLLFAQVRRLRSEGAAVLYISHRLEEILSLADRVSVLRDGHRVATQPTTAVSIDQIIHLMVGRPLEPNAFWQSRKPGAVALSVRGLCAGDRVREVSFEVRQGEIVGLAGLMGAGRTETLRALFGADPMTAGSVHLHGQSVPARIRSPRDAVRLGLALVTEDRKSQGLLLPWSLGKNLTLTALNQVSHFGGWIRGLQEGQAAGDWMQRLGIRAHSVRQIVAELSGGNQQKVVFAKWLWRECSILLFDEPTRGIDVGARFEIYRLMHHLAGQGKALVVVSSDLKELMATCDRIMVMSAGRIAATFDRGDWTQDAIMAAALSGHLGAGVVLSGRGAGS